MSVPDSPAGARRIRWPIFGFLFAFSVLAYVQRTSVAVAAEPMMADLGITQEEVGWLLTAFLLSYTAFQFPGGILSQRLGARRALFALGILAFLATLATATSAWVLSGVGLLMVLLAARFALGVAQAPLFPVFSGAIERWFPVAQWAMPQGVLAAAMNLGSALTPPLVAGLMQAFGWQVALMSTAVPALLLAAAWLRYARDTPAAHPGVDAAELAELADNPPPSIEGPVTWARIRGLLANRDLLLLTISYFLMNYVFYLLTFWCFLYLVQERHFAIIEGGWLASLPYVAAAVGSIYGGTSNTWLCRRFGERRGYRLGPIAALPAAGLFLLLVAVVPNAYWAILALCGAFACVEFTEAPYWAATMRVCPSDTMAATGILNTGANLGGILATPIVAALSGHGHWALAFVTGAGFAAASAALWCWVDVTRGEPAPAPAPAPH